MKERILRCDIPIRFKGIPSITGNIDYELLSTINVFGRTFECYKVYNPLDNNKFTGVFINMLPQNEYSRDGKHKLIPVEKLISYGLDKSSVLKDYIPFCLAIKEDEPI